MAWPLALQEKSWAGSKANKARTAMIFFMRARCLLRNARQPKLPRGLWLLVVSELQPQAELDLPRRIDEIAVGAGFCPEQGSEGSAHRRGRPCSVEVQAGERINADSIAAGHIATWCGNGA